MLLSFGCSFAFSPLVSSVVLHLLHSFGVFFKENSMTVDPSKLTPTSIEVISKQPTLNVGVIGKNTLETGGEDVKTHSKRVEKM